MSSSSDDAIIVQFTVPVQVQRLQYRIYNYYKYYSSNIREFFHTFSRFEIRDETVPLALWPYPRILRTLSLIVLKTCSVN